jgi:hypothetical protein
MALDALRFSPDPKHLKTVPEAQTAPVLITQKEKTPIFRIEDRFRQGVIQFCKALDDPSKARKFFRIDSLKVKEGCSRRSVFRCVAEKDMRGVEVAMVEPSLMHSASQIRDFSQKQDLPGF